MRAHDIAIAQADRDPAIVREISVATHLKAGRKIAPEPFMLRPRNA